MAGRAHWLLAFMVGCAGAAHDVPQGLPAHMVVPRRVVQVLQRHHLRPQALDNGLSNRLFERLLVGACEPTVRDDARVHFAADRERLDDAVREGDFSFSTRLAERCQGQRLAAADAQATTLDALAKIQDPHSAYLDVEALRLRREEGHPQDASRPRVSARVVVRDGVHIGVLRAPSFYLRTDRSTAGDVRQLLPRLRDSGAQVLLLDLRGNTGGVESEATALVGLLAGPGPVAQLVRAGGVIELLETRDKRAWHAPIVVAVDAMTASVAEVTAAALQDRAGAAIVGQRTHGKGTGQTLVLLSSPRGGRDGAVQVTDRSYHRFDGTPLQLLGVTPDLQTPAASATAITTERERAGALHLQAIPALSPRPARQPAPAAHITAATVSLLRSGTFDGEH